MMDVNPCDRTSISNVTILNEKNRKAFQFRRLAHKMTNLTRRIQKEKTQSYADRSQFQNIQSKFNILTQTATQVIEKYSQIKETIKNDNIKTLFHKEIEVESQSQEAEKQESELNNVKSGFSESRTNQSSIRVSLNKGFQVKKNFENKSPIQELKRNQTLQYKRTKKGVTVHLKSRGMTNQQFFYVLVFSMTICFLVRNTFSHL